MSKKIYIVFEQSKTKEFIYKANKSVFKFKPTFHFSSMDKSISLKVRDELRRHGSRSFIKTRCL